MSRRGVSPAKAARLLGLHRNTIYNWARRSVAGETSRLAGVEAHPITGYLSIPIEVVRELKRVDDDER